VRISRGSKGTANFGRLPEPPAYFMKGMILCRSMMPCTLHDAVHHILYCLIVLQVQAQIPKDKVVISGCQKSCTLYADLDIVPHHDAVYCTSCTAPLYRRCKPKSPRTRESFLAARRVCAALQRQIVLQTLPSHRCTACPVPPHCTAGASSDPQGQGSDHWLPEGPA
jgi:hypothetical protein